MYYNGECIVGAIVENGLIAKENGGCFVFLLFSNHPPKQLYISCRYESVPVSDEPLY